MFHISGLTACGVTVAGRTYCWGSGMGTQTGAAGGNAPKAYASTLVLRSVSASRYHACGLTLDGTAYCWGINLYGRFGNGQESAMQTEVPQPVSGGHKFAKLEASEVGTIALTTSGKVYAWGTNEQWMPGPSVAYRTTPVAIAPELTFKDFSRPMGYVAAIATDGVLWCWGDGTGASGLPSCTPTPVQLLGDSPLRFSTLASSGSTTLMVTTSGETYAMGVNPVTGAFYSGLTRAAAGLSFTQVALTDYTHYGLTSDGRLFAWGDNRFGQVGDGTTTLRAAPVQVGGSLRFRQVAAAFGYAAALTTGGELHYWGVDPGAAFGNGSEDYSATPYSLTPRGPSERSLSIRLAPDGPTLTAGQSVDITVLVSRVGGGFVTSGANIGAPDAVTISVQDLPAGVTASFPFSAVVPVGQSGTQVRLTASSNMSGGVGNFTIKAQASNMPAQPAQPISVLKVNSTGSTGLSLSCAATAAGGSVPASFPAGYHCMRNSSGATVPGKFSVTTLTSSPWWVEETIGLCVNWRNDGGRGRSSARFKGGFGGGTTTSEGHWGLLSRADGRLEGVANARYLFTSNLDAQTQLLAFNEQSYGSVINNYNFRPRASCPW
jgi:alpha-tubulin suppressor-like RCC1 family protein